MRNSEERSDQEVGLVVVEDMTDIASELERDTRPESAPSTQNRPLPTDSMMTVRLSDTPSLSSEHFPTPDRKSLTDSVRTSVRFSQPASFKDITPPGDNDEACLDEDTEVVHTATSNRASSMSITSIQEEEYLASASSTIRSRSDSSATASSNGSAQVDWDELERSEEQAPRDEGSDEV